jgi:hypothetical protein
MSDAQAEVDRLSRELAKNHVHMTSKAGTPLIKVGIVSNWMDGLPLYEKLNKLAGDLDTAVVHDRHSNTTGCDDTIVVMVMAALEELSEELFRWCRDTGQLP